MRRTLVLLCLASGVGCGAVAEPDSSTVAPPDAEIVVSEVGVLDAPSIPDVKPVASDVVPSAAPVGSTPHRVTCAPTAVVCDPSVPRGARSMSLGPFDGSRSMFVGSRAWDGREMFVLARGDASCAACTPFVTAAYDPTTDAWRMLPPPPIDRDKLPVADIAFETVAHGGKLFLRLARGTPPYWIFLEWREGVGWRALPPIDGVLIEGSALTWSRARDELLFYGLLYSCVPGEGCDRSFRIFAWDDVGARWNPRARAPAEAIGRPTWIDGRLVAGPAWYDPVADVWTLGPSMPWPMYQDHLLDLSDCGSGGFAASSRPIYGEPSMIYWNPATLEWERTPPPPVAFTWHGMFSTGSRVVIWSSSTTTAHGVPPYDAAGFAFDLTTARWEPLAADRPEYRGSTEPVWTGCDAIFFDVSLGGAPPIASRYRF